MASVILKNKRNHRINDRDFVVVDDITGIRKMRSECKIDGYGFLSAHGDRRNPQETPPIITEDMAAWPDPRPITPPNYISYNDYVYFTFSAEFVDYVIDTSVTFDASGSMGLNGPVTLYEWAVDGVYVATGMIAAVPMNSGTRDITLRLTDVYGNTGTYTFEYEFLVVIGLESGGSLLREDGGYILYEGN